MTTANSRRSRQSSSRSRRDVATLAYWRISREPLQMLVFLLPFVVAYELGLIFVLRSGNATITNRAHEAISEFFGLLELRGVGLTLPGVALIVVLLAWHLILRARWRVDWRALPLMLAESAAAVLPLVVLGQVIVATVPAVAPALLASIGGSSQGGLDGGIGSLDVLGRIAISIGAGLYEELLFRMALIAVLHTILVDMLRAPERWGLVIAVVVSAVAFAVYHPVRAIDGAIDWRRLTFFFVAGIYLGALFVLRGFGIAVATHALYDVVTSLFAIQEPGA